MKKIKALFLIISILCILMIFTSCNTNKNSNNRCEIITSQDPYIEVVEPFSTIYLMKDTSGNVIKHILYNSATNKFWIYSFEYTYDYRNKAYVISDSNLEIMNIEDSNEIPDIQDNIINNNSNTTNNSNDNINLVPKFDEANPVGTVWAHDEYIKIIQGDLKYDSLWNAYYIELTIINHNTANVRVSTRDISVNDWMLGSLSGAVCEVPSGKSAKCEFYIYEDELSALGITNMQELEFNLVVYDSDNIMRNHFIDKIMTIYLTK